MCMCISSIPIPFVIRDALQMQSGVEHPGAGGVGVGVGGGYG